MALSARPWLRLAFTRKRRLGGLAARALSSAVEDAATAWRDTSRHHPPQTIEQWRADDARLHQRMRDLVPSALKHNGEEAFDNHLVGVQSVLRSWDATEDVCNAALFHSIYGTEGFQGFKLPLSQRSEIARLIGPYAERLAWIFCMVDRASVDATVLHPQAERAPGGQPPSFRARAELGAFEIPLHSNAEWRDFVTLTLADWLEQVEGAARKENPLACWPVGKAWAYRRDAYAAMAETLGSMGVEAAPKMHAQVYAREPSETRHLVQPVTPPMCPAALEAREAIFYSSMDNAPASLAAEWTPSPRA